jgi:hypothetical protein
MNVSRKRVEVAYSYSDDEITPELPKFPKPVKIGIEKSSRSLKRFDKDFVYY